MVEWTYGSSWIRSLAVDAWINVSQICFVTVSNKNNIVAYLTNGKEVLLQCDAKEHLDEWIDVICGYSCTVTDFDGYEHKVTGTNEEEPVTTTNAKDVKEIKYKGKIDDTVYVNNSTNKKDKL